MGQSLQGTRFSTAAGGTGGSSFKIGTQTRQTGPGARGIGEVPGAHDFTQSWVRPVTANATAVSQVTITANGVNGKGPKPGTKGSLYTDVKRL